MSQTQAFYAYYDGWCPLCTRAAERCRVWDRAGRVQWVSFRSETQLPLPLSIMQERIVGVNGAGRAFEGIDTVYEVCKRIPRLRWLAPGIWLSRKLGVGSAIYQWIARHRAILPTGCENGECALPHKDPHDTQAP